MWLFKSVLFFYLDGLPFLSVENIHLIGILSNEKGTRNKIVLIMK